MRLFWIPHRPTPSKAGSAQSARAEVEPVLKANPFQLPGNSVKGWADLSAKW